MYIFYDTKGGKLNEQEFIKIYSDIYYYSNDIYKETVIEKSIYDTTNREPEDLIEFLKWKVGDKNSNNGEYIITQYGKRICLDSVKKLAKKIDDSWTKMPTRELYELLIREKINNLGTVYTLALLNYITRGREPIYDKYAKIALDVILDENHGFREKMKYAEPSEKSCVETVMKQYENYKEALKKIFQDSWKTSRNIDRALWTYGHMFS